MTRAHQQGLARVPLEALRFHPRNIRTNLGDLRELAASIKAEGVLVPLMAQRTPSGGLQLLHGHRRWAAADMVGRKTVPVVIIDRTLTDDQAILLMLAEDKKEAVAAADRARAVEALHTEFGYDWLTLAERLGISDEEMLEWRRGKPTTAPSRPVLVASARQPRPAQRSPRRHAPRRSQPPRVPMKKLHGVLAEWEGRAPAELLEQLQELLGGWSPVEQVPAIVVPDEEADEVEVAQLMGGERKLADATIAAAAAAIARMTEQGRSATQIADVLGCSDRHVVRYRAAVAEQAAAS